MADKRTYEERREYQKAWRERNKEKWSQYSRNDYANHREARLEKNRKWLSDNPDAECLTTEARKERQSYGWDRYKRALNALRRYEAPDDKILDLLKQLDNGPCDSCTKIGKMVVDHDHKTGKFRGIICRECNSAIGLFKEDIVLMERAAEYMKR